MTSIRTLLSTWIVILLAVLTCGFGGTEYWAEGIFSVSISVLSAGLLFSLYRPGRLAGAWPVAGPFVACALIGVGQLAFDATVYPHATLTQSLRWSTLAALAFATSYASSDSRTRSVLTDSLYYFGAGVSLFGLVHYVTCGGRLLWIGTNEFGSTFAPFINRDHYAAFCELVLPFAVYRMYERNRNSVAHIVVAAILFAALIASASRTGVAIGMSEVLLISILQGQLLSKRVAFAVVGLGGLALLFSAIAGPDVLLKKLLTHGDWQYRSMMAGSAWQMGVERPVTGHGLGTFEVAYPRFARFDLGLRVDHAHNEWLEWFAEGGIWLPVIMGVFLLGTLRGIRQQPWTIGVPAVLAHGLVDFPWRIPAIAAYAVAIAAVAQPLRFAASSKTLVKKSRDVGEQPMCKVPAFEDSSTKPK